MTPRDPADLRDLLGIPFTPEQLAAATAPLAPQVIVAGAGSGKTTVMAARVVWLVTTGQVGPGQVLGLTFTNKAAAELAERVRGALERAGALDTTALDSGPGDPAEVPGEPEIATYHAFAGRLLSEHGLRAGLEPSARLLTDATRFQLAAEVLRAAPASFTPPTGASTGRPRRFASLVEDLVALDAELAEHLVPPDRLRDHDEQLLAELADTPLSNAALRRVPEAARGRLQLLERVRAYRARKRERDLLDFGDQIAVSALLARDAPEVGRMLREQYAVVLLDEYQDTSVAQRVLLSSLFGAGGGTADTAAGGAPDTAEGGTAAADRRPPPGAGHAVTAVGDPCQAIYGWRGASVANLDDFPTHFPHRDGTPAARYTLTENRRSGGRLLTLANELAGPLRARHPGVAPLRAADDATGAGRVRCALLPDRDAEHRWLADHLAHLVATGTPPGGVAVLCRTAADFPALQAALTEAGLPTEVVGISGLLHLPEVADLVAVCRVLADPTANAALVRLLAGPRWRIGPRDLALLGRRARYLAAPGGPHTGDADRLAAAVADTDPAETVSLADALDTFTGGVVEEPDDGLPFSAEARVRFAHLATELRDLRRGMSDPLPDLLHRVLGTTGLEVELSASPQALAARRRETLHAFLAVAAEFAAGGHRVAVDRDATLPSFLAYLDAAEEHDNGLDGTLPSTDDSVKILTAHKAKGLEWDVVALPGLHHDEFPQARAQDSWLRHAHALPVPLRGDAATLPALDGISGPALRAHDTAAAEHREREELRLAYVAVTRPRALLLGSGHRWGPTRKRPRQPSPYLEALRAHCAAAPENGEVEHWAPEPPPDTANPLLTDGARPEQPWPLPLDPVAAARRREAASQVLAALSRQRTADGTDPGEAAAPRPGPDDSPGATELTPEERRTVESWDRDAETLTAELRRSRARVREVTLPPSLSATQLQWLAADPEGFARELARPMPRRPQPAARRGTRFHAWVESRFEELELPLLDPDELPGTDPAEPIRDERDLAALKEAFERTPYASRTPYQVEAPFQIRLAGRTVRGRIDAVYRDNTTDGGFEVIDWKTGRPGRADPLQLAVYRLAWAERHGLSPERVAAAFLYVRTGEVVRPAPLPDRAGLERILRGEESWPADPPR